MNRKDLLFSLFLLLAVLFVLNYDDLKYGLAQAGGQLKIVNNSKQIEYYLNDPSFPDSLKQKIKLIEEVRAFAIDSIGMINSENYSSIYNQKDSAVMWVVNASEPFAIEAYQWCFPVAGCFPYKGFFNRAAALKEELSMKNQNFDTYLRTVDGWSTLGFFDDPILSNMLLETEGELAELIIHELTHASIYVKDSVDFNENLASFIGETGAIAFLSQKFGKNSTEYRTYLERLEDSRLFEKKMFRCLVQIQRFYDNSEEISDTADRLRLKNQVIKQNICAINRNEFHSPDRFKWLELDQFFPNNAYFSLFMTYNNQGLSFENEFEAKGKDLKLFFSDLLGKYAK